MKVEIKDIKHPDILADEEYKAQISGLANSIKEHGLLHSITVAEVDGKYQLITGLKRLLASKEAGLTDIECTINTGDGKLVAIEENLRRYNLPWYEQVELVRQLHEYKQSIHGKPKHPNDDGWSLRDLKDELGRSLGGVSEDVKLAEAVLNNPELKKIKDRRTALKVVRMHSKRTEAEMTADRPHNFDENQIFCGDSLDILPIFPVGCFDACVTDPPWMKFGGRSEFEKDENTLPVFEQLFRVLKYDAFLYMFCGIQDFVFYSEELPKMGYRIQEYPIIWHKVNTVSMGRRPFEHTRDLELILLAVKGNPVLVDSGNVSSILKYPVVPSGSLIHPNQKPLDLMRHLVNLCTYEGSMIIDPFAGSGSTLIAAKDLNRRFIGIEREKKFVNLIEEQLNDSGNQNTT